MVDFIRYASLTVCYFFQFLFFSLLLDHWREEGKRLKLTSRTVSAQLPIDQAWSLVRLRASMSLYFPSVRFWPAEETVMACRKGRERDRAESD